MTVEEREHFNSLPQKLTVYRGMSLKEYESGYYGISWTLSRDVADKFSKSIRSGNNNGVVVEAVADKDNCIAFFNERKEEEIIVIDICRE
ncbi:MAG: hypothetical protein RR854_08915 [Muribaculaceae bacterium]